MRKDKKKIILDACCGSRMFWFDKKHPNSIFIDNRSFSKQLIWEGKGNRKGQQAFLEIKPDIVMDFRKMKFKNNTFNLVVFDPPHIIENPDASYAGYQKKKYGSLHPKTWKNDLKQGFSECFRVLKPNGILIFKWNELHIKVSEILKLTDNLPLFGHKSGKQSKTHWITFMKL